MAKRPSLFAQNRAALDPYEKPPPLADALAQALQPSGSDMAPAQPGILASAVRSAGGTSPATMVSAMPAPTASPMGQAAPAPFVPDHAPLDLSQATTAKGRGVGGLLADIAFGALLGVPSPGRVRELTEERRQREQQDRQGVWARQDAQRQQDRQWQVEDRDIVAKRPQYFMAGRDRVAFDPTTGESKVVYDAPEDYQTYAQTLGLNPGDSGYDDAVSDYVLRGAGPTAQAARRALVSVQQGARLAQKAAPTYKDLHPTVRPDPSAAPPKSANAVVAPILLKLSRGQPLSAGERQALTYARPGGGRQRPANPDSMIPGTAALPVTVTTPEQARLLPKGTVFRNPQGKVMTR